MVLLLLAIAPEALACTCDYSKTGTDARTALRKARAVFVGKVKAVTPARQVEGDFTSPTDSFVQFTVERHWKGVKSHEIAVIADDPRGCAGPRFEVGKSYLVFAYGKRLWTGGCTRSQHLEYAEKDLQFLGQAKFPKPIKP